MRHKLKHLINQRVLMTARVGGYGIHKATSGKGVTVVLQHVCTLDGQELSSHLWVQDGRPFKRIGCRVGDRVQFAAWVKVYHKRIQGELVTDYGIEQPTQLQRV